jgi:hypothetical protein
VTSKGDRKLAIAFFLAVLGFEHRALYLLGLLGRRSTLEPFHQPKLAIWNLSANENSVPPPTSFRAVC